uniref:Uncharacterized protein n=1 Tax=Biomphalaria glabrata TaxID=6526 RepID=A0A2C9M0H1_BIOGL
MPRSLTDLPYLSMLLVEVLTEGLFAVLITLWVVNKFDDIHYKDTHKTVTTNKTTLPDQNHKETCLDKTLDTQKAAACISFDQQVVQLKRKERIMFLLFANFQIIFLIFLFLATDWIL